MWDGPATAQAIPKFNRPGDLVAAQDLARAAIQIVEDRLDGLDWLVGHGGTIADIAVYPYVGLIWEGQVELTSYPNVLPVCGGSRCYRTMSAWMVWRIKPKRRTYAASSKMILRVWRSPERIRLTPCRMRTRYLLRVPCTGRSSTENITALPRVRCTTSAHDCMRGRCSVKINSPPVKSVPGGGGVKAPGLGS